MGSDSLCFLYSILFCLIVCFFCFLLFFSCFLLQLRIYIPLNYTSRHINTCHGWKQNGRTQSTQLEAVRHPSDLFTAATRLHGAHRFPPRFGSRKRTVHFLVGRTRPLENEGVQVQWLCPKMLPTCLEVFPHVPKMFNIADDRQ